MSKGMYYCTPIDLVYLIDIVVPGIQQSHASVAMHMVTSIPCNVLVDSTNMYFVK